jgi:hypothetical protein
MQSLFTSWFTQIHWKAVLLQLRHQIVDSALILSNNPAILQLENDFMDSEEETTTTTIIFLHNSIIFFL